MNELMEMYKTILERKANPEEGSYTSYLFDKGLEKILKKVGEECTEVIIASMKGDADEIAGEMNDLIYHLLVLLAEKDIPLSKIEEVMAARNEKTHNLKAERKPVTNL